MDNVYRKTPIMGWASWNCFRTNITEESLKKQIDALKVLGLDKYGYIYFNIDDGFFGGRDKNGVLQFHKKRFPNGIKVIADYAHQNGLKAGIYSDGGDNTCGHFYDNEGENGNNVGLYNHEEQDLKMYLEDFGFDFIKVDWCGGLNLGLDEKEQYTKISKIIDDIRKRTGRCIVYSHGTAVLLVKSESAVSVPDANEVLEYKKPKDVEKISTDKADELIANGAVLLDVRSKNEYESGHLDGAINAPYTGIHGDISSLIPDKEQKIIVYCTTGKRSSQAKYTLDYMGYKNVYYLGGIEL